MANNDVMERIIDLEREITALPTGSVFKKTIKVKVYYYHRVTRDGKPTDNPVNEALNGWIKEELYIDFKFAECRSLEDAKNVLEDYIKYYNEQSPCYALGYNTPSNYRKRNYKGEIEHKNTFEKTNDFDEVDRAKRLILKLYCDDIRKHAESYEMKVEAIYDELPSQLKNQNRHFKLSSLKQGARFDEYKEAMFWLSDAMIVNNCYNSTEPNVGLSLNMDRTLLKCYMGDTGLLISHTFDENGIVREEIYKKLLLDKLEVNMGMVTENIVAQMLVSSGHKLFFYANSSRNDASSRMEIDFLISKSKISNRHNISPIEVKSGKNYTTKSLNKFKTKFSEQTHIPYILHSGDYKEENGCVYLPLYMTMFL